MNLIKNTIILNIGQLLSILFSLLFQIVLFKTFRVEEAGKILAYYSLANILSVISCFGLSNYLIAIFASNPVAIEKNSRTISKHIVYTSMLTLIILLVYYTFNDENILFTLAFFPAIITISLCGILLSISQIKKNFILVSFFSFFVVVLKLLSLILSYIAKKDSLTLFSVVNFSLFTVSCVVLYYLVQKNLNNKGENNTYGLNFIKEIFPFGISNVNFLVYSNITIVILNIFDMNSQAAYLSISLLLFNCILMIPTVLIQKIYAVKVFTLIENDFKSLSILMNKMKLLLFSYFVFIIFSYLFLGRIIIAYFFPELNSNIVFTFNVLLISLLARLLNLSNGIILASKKYISTKLKIESLINVVLIIGVIVLANHKNYEFLLYYLISVDILWFLINRIIIKMIKRRSL